MRVNARGEDATSSQYRSGAQLRSPRIPSPIAPRAHACATHAAGAGRPIRPNHLAHVCVLRCVLVPKWAMGLARVTVRFLVYGVSDVARMRVVAQVCRTIVARVAVVVTDLSARWLRPQKGVGDQSVQERLDSGTVAVAQLDSSPPIRLRCAANGLATPVMRPHAAHGGHLVPSFPTLNRSPFLTIPSHVNMSTAQSRQRGTATAPEATPLSSLVRVDRGKYSLSLCRAAAALRPDSDSLSWLSRPR